MKKCTLVFFAFIYLVCMFCSDESVNAAMDKQVSLPAQPAGLQRLYSLDARWEDGLKIKRKIERKIGRKIERSVEFSGMSLPLPAALVENASEAEYIAYLTFDDGPSSNTLMLLDKLDKYGVKATFFITGSRIQRYPQSVEEIVKRGHVAGVHSYSHEYAKIYSSVDAFVADLDAAETAMPEGYKKIYRFPGGVKRAKKMGPKLADALEERGFLYYEWDIDIGDGLAKQPTLTFIKNYWQGEYAKKKRRKQQHRLVILLHDLAGKKASIAFLDTLIPQLQADGYIFGVLS